ncbi:MAG TPA: succinylglutamate-semialdehyde dehydrogenase [Vitreimonas sp.]|uniref:succinylglutamate-semialdehyde dehydrogenase n=1 Tax=Vitreimonas sp. TaxID=3069702 RepID=UPI002D2D3438|nr:succinylglutamate-semialdehyde dehydrogenase [Vitreimonas sp.]HYD89244.1 succinylglutamate-semialdehyde dehydrogenase [Vitreimonas sp.]
MRTELYIDGAWRAGGGERFASHDPASGDRVWEGRAATADDVAEAMAAARLAFPSWSRRPVEERIAVVRAFGKAIETRAETIAQTISREMGKALWDAKGEVQAMIGKIELSIRAQSERAGFREEKAAFGAMTLSHHAHGVLAVFGPFNFPGHLPNGHIVPALLAGNVVLFKPSELTPGVGALMAEAWEEAGLPAGVLNLLQGGRDTGAALLDAQGLNGVLFTGSAHTGALIHKKFAGRPDVVLALELGGNNPLIVWPPVDAQAAANLIVHSAFATSGQRCSCARRLIVPQGPDGDTIIAALAALTPNIKVGPATQTPEPFLGPLVNAESAERAVKFEQGLMAMGAKPIVPVKREGATVHPAIIDVTGLTPPDEELFGPLLQVYRVSDFDHALDVANATRYGLAGGLISDDPTLWARVKNEMRAGVLNWNRPTTGASGAMPFGGPGLSGSLRPSAYYAADYVAYPVATQLAEKAAPIAAPGLPK